MDPDFTVFRRYRSSPLPFSLLSPPFLSPFFTASRSRGRFALSAPSFRRHILRARLDMFVAAGNDSRERERERGFCVQRSPLDVGKTPRRGRSFIIRVRTLLLFTPHVRHDVHRGSIVNDIPRFLSIVSSIPKECSEENLSFRLSTLRPPRADPRATRKKEGKEKRNESES